MSKKGVMYFASSVAVFEVAKKMMTFSSSLGPLKVSNVKEVGRLERLKGGIFGSSSPLYKADIDGLTEEWIAILETKGCWITQLPEKE